MRAVQCTLLSTSITQDNIGNDIEVVYEKVIPIIKVEDIYANEFYQANQQGLKPSLRLRISALNYSDEQELIYMNKNYTIIRTQEPTADEVILVCERKIANENR